MIGRTTGKWWRAETAPAHEVRIRSKRVGSIAVLALLAFACADPYSGAFDPADADEPRHFVILPVNLTIKTPPEFEPKMDDLFGAIAGYIRDGGDSIETFSRQAATAQWAASIIAVKESESLKDNFEAAMRAYVTHLASTRSFDAVIAPSIVFRTTRTKERRVKWDGVFRKLKVINLSDEAKNMGLGRSVTVEISGVSLHVMVFDPKGDLIFQKFGGLDLAHNVDMAGAEFTMNPRLSLKEDLLKDSEHLEEGIEEAFDPYIPRR